MDSMTEGDVSREGVDRRQLARALHVDFSSFRAGLLQRSAERMAKWSPRVKRTGFLSSAANMADWLALREADLRPLQAPLSRLGLSTLGHLDGHVRPSLDAVMAALSAIAGEPSPVFPGDAAFDADARTLLERRDALFGNRDGGQQTRIMVTLPTEAAADPGLIRALVAEGVDCFRINCAHDGPAEWAAMVGSIRKEARAAGRHLPVSMDLGGPKFRILTVTRDRKNHRFQPGDRFALATISLAAPEDLVCATLSHPALLEALRPGMAISIDDGKLGAIVRNAEPTCAILEVTRAPSKGARLKPEKGVNLPGVDLRVAALTSADLTALDFIVAHADLVAFSFVQTVEDVRALVSAMQQRALPDRPLPAILLKIETPLALRNLPDLIVEAGGVLPVAVMIARGDLAVEIGFDRLSEIQEEILWLCEAAQVPVVWATQVLEGMVKDGQASRAEVTDAAMSQRAECVMLNKGPHIVPAVTFLRSILSRMDRHQSKKSARLGPLSVWAGEAANP